MLSCTNTKMKSALPNPAENRLAYLDGVRAFLAIYVMMYHSLLMGWPLFRKIHDPLPVYLWPFNWGRVAVAGFIVLSGFCLSLPVVRDGYLRGGTNEFIRRRAIRILPTFYAALLFALAAKFLVIGTHPDGSHADTELPISLTAILSCIFMVQNVVTHSKINGVFWSIAVEWQIYFFFPLFVWMRNRIGIFRTALIVFLISQALWLPTHSSKLHGLTLNYYGFFVIGMLAADLAQRGRSGAAVISQKMLFVIAAVSILIAITGTWVSLIRPAWPADLMVDLPFAIFIAAALTLGFLNSTVSRTLSAGPMAAIGVCTYSVYLIHMPLQEILRNFLVKHFHASAMTVFLSMLAATPLILLCAYGFFKIAEEPVLKRKRRSRTVADLAPAHAAP
jgi:peptidoglycan/LPS O-acetylase OafA/YrhL